MKKIVDILISIDETLDGFITIVVGGTAAIAISYVLITIACKLQGWV